MTAKHIAKLGKRQTSPPLSSLRLLNKLSAAQVAANAETTASQDAPQSTATNKSGQCRPRVQLSKVIINSNNAVCPQCKVAMHLCMTLPGRLQCPRCLHITDRIGIESRYVDAE